VCIFFIAIKKGEDFSPPHYSIFYFFYQPTVGAVRATGVDSADIYLLI
jgi:hypothetical protein